MNIIHSKFLQLTQNDFVKGLVVTVLATVLATIEQALTTGGAINFETVLHVALIAGLSYLSKNLLTTEKGNVLGVISTR